jgi:cellobiose phosphorylase
LSGEAFYVRDEQTGRYWSPTPLPARGQTPYVTRQGFGYSVFEHTEDGIVSELWVYVAVDAPVKIAMLKLRNLSTGHRHLSVTGYWEWALGEFRHKNAPHVITEFDLENGAILARNPYNTDFEGRTAFVTSSDLRHPMSGSFTGDRTEFLGRNNTLAQPAALGRARLSGKTGIGLDPCAALQVPVSLAPGEEREITFALGAARSSEQARQLIQTFQGVESCREALQAVWAYWNNALGTIYVETPDSALNVLANGWLLYQTLSCRMWARSGFYHPAERSVFAISFRTQWRWSTRARDAARTVAPRRRPPIPRRRRSTLVAPPHNRGVRTHISDDYLWLPCATCRYVETIGDTGVLDEVIPFLEGRALRPEEEACYDTAQVARESGTLYEHCVRAIQNGLNSANTDCR